MFLKLVLLAHLTVSLGSPFHKYPFAFLLDVGNEELEKTNSEQIRVSLPGGTVALRHPGVGDGDTIAHVRVSGVDFGADVKANIVDGGPGYKYVVLVFVGKPNVAYDAVVTIRRLQDELQDEEVTEEMRTNGNSVETTTSYEEGNDIEVKHNRKQDLEQANSNVHYTQDEVSHRINEERYPGEKYIEYSDESNRNEENDNANEDNDENSNSEDEADEETSPDTGPHEIDESYDGEAVPAVNNYLYDNFIEPKQYSGVTPSVVVTDDGRNQEEADYPADPLEIDQMFNDEDVHEDPESVRNYNDDTLNFAAYESAVVES